jgi:NADPH:quinone reductase-like Zn-dependent oxidoreductase
MTSELKGGLRRRRQLSRVSVHWLNIWIPDVSDVNTILRGGALLVNCIETATRVLDRLGLVSGDTVLVPGASGAVGRFAVQQAITRGARVIGTASERNHAFVRFLGAEPTSMAAVVVPAHLRGVVPPPFTRSSIGVALK